MYRYFIQPQLDKANNSLIGYELLMKEKKPEGWRPPANFSDVPSHLMAQVLVATTKLLSLKIGSVSVNINRNQLMDEEVRDAIIEAQRILRPLKLVVELTEDTPNKDWSNEEYISLIKEFIDYGMDFSLDDCGTGTNQMDQIKDMIPLASEIKFAIQNFGEKLRDPDIENKVIYWRDICKKENIRFILEGIEDEKDDALADKLEIDLRQGYYYGKPRLLKLKADDDEF
ncbi:EAL domain-containing protein [Companilactobacillus paralimentarius]|jgi:FOG: EAL domain|uniref:EAL domain-containing protein n=1 Tax=Companilactobacillus paralimentarius TaxID=83526 RepID=UPI000469D34C|nr:EAL domain-containing protein [Companilactobacillus paralimentarius]KAE9562420.1 diguanylate cyclase [Companilactobacillus paralimentarius]MDR4934725.1 EAL domain-containing protein [Companilactobacillus paralimentarius]QFR68858.1 EAL domain-containing protein [Companilactobacillus paralimentarius]